VINFFPLAFLMGLFGSLHCAVMCGPIALGMPFQKKSFLQSALQLLLYQLGRILVYTLLGLVVGALGSTIRIYANQKSLGITIGILLLLFTAFQYNAKYRRQFSIFQNKLLNPISKLMGTVFKLKLWGLFAGMLNGLIPCGMVYLALATALNTANVQAGGMFMFLFGLGTMPLMMMISIGGIYLKKYIRFNTQQLVPWFMVFFGLLFLLRALNLGIPFLSPELPAVYRHSVLCQ